MPLQASARHFPNASSIWLGMILWVLQGILMLAGIVALILTFLISIPFIMNEVTFEVKPWLGIAYLVIIQLGLSYIIFSIAIKYVSALDAIIYPVIEPVFNPILAFLFLGEMMSGNAQFGGALVLIGVIGRGLLQAAQTKKGRTHE